MGREIPCPSFFYFQCFTISGTDRLFPGRAGGYLQSGRFFFQLVQALRRQRAGGFIELFLLGQLPLPVDPAADLLADLLQAVAIGEGEGALAVIVLGVAIMHWLIVPR